MITLPFPPAALSGHANGKGFWQKSTVTKLWRAKAEEAANSITLPSFNPADRAYTAEGDIHVHVTFVPPTKQGDRVNFPNRMKPIFDGLADALGVNDARFIPHFYYCAPQKPGRVEIRIGQ